jgi:hydroxymethylpyrimidine pyrophosphatase-like HAD family hydrolase
MQECKKLFSDHPELMVVQSDPYDLEIYCRQGGKGNALRALASVLGFPYKQSIAVGDSTNDASMIRYAGMGLAVKNAVPELKELADFTICNNDQNAIAYIYERYIK